MVPTEQEHKENRPLRSFSIEILDEARSLLIRPLGISNRKDVTGVTIDGPYTSEIDDAFWVEKRGSNYQLTVSIADCAAAVPQGSLTDNEAYRRGFTLYMGPRSASYMLPHPLVGSLLSLNPHRLTPTISYQISIDYSFNVQEVQLEPTLFQNMHRYVYEDVEKVLSEGRDEPDWKFLSTAYELASGLFEKRQQRGALTYFDINKKLASNEEGFIQPISSFEANRGHLIIQEFMILANELGARFLLESGYPALYRNHIANNRNTHLKTLLLSNDQTIHTQLERYNRRLLTYLQKAEYSPYNEGHFGLGSPAYAHTTSPIRRYNDLINQRIIHEILKHQDPPYTIEDLENISARLNSLAKEEKNIYVERAQNLARRIVDSGNANPLGTLNKGEFLFFIKTVNEQEKLNRDFADGIINRIQTGAITPEQAIYILESMNNEDEIASEIQTSLLAFLRTNTNFASSLFMWMSATYGWSLPNYTSKIIYRLGKTEIWESVAKLMVEDREEISHPSGGNSKNEAQHHSRVSLIANLFKLVDPQITQYNPSTLVEPLLKEKEEQARRMEVPNIIREGISATKAQGMNKVNAIVQKHQLKYNIDIIAENPLGNIKSFTAEIIVYLSDKETIRIQGRGISKQGAKNSAALKAYQILRNRINDNNSL